MNTKRAGVVVAGSLVGIGLLALAGGASSMVPKDSRQADSAVTDVNNELLVGKR